MYVDRNGFFSFISFPTQQRINRQDRPTESILDATSDCIATENVYLYVFVKLNERKERHSSSSSRNREVLLFLSFSFISFSVLLCSALFILIYTDGLMYVCTYVCM